MSKNHAFQLVCNKLLNQTFSHKPKGKKYFIFIYTHAFKLNLHRKSQIEMPVMMEKVSKNHAFQPVCDKLLNQTFSHKPIGEKYFISI